MLARNREIKVKLFFSHNSKVKKFQSRLFQSFLSLNTGRYEESSWQTRQGIFSLCFLLSPIFTWTSTFLSLFVALFLVVGFSFSFCIEIQHSFFDTFFRTLENFRSLWPRRLKKSEAKSWQLVDAVNFLQAYLQFFLFQIIFKKFIRVLFWILCNKRDNFLLVYQNPSWFSSSAPSSSVHLQ